MFVLVLCCETMLGEKADPLADSLARRRRQDQQPLVQAVQSRGKLYKIRDEDVEFANSYCLATYGNWLFMVDYWYNLYLLNIFTHERIDLTPVESQLGTTKLERTLKGWFCISNGHRKRNRKDIKIVSPVFWIDE